MTAKQGHRYRYTLTDREVLALSNGPRPTVAHLLPNQFWPLGTPFEVEADRLEPLGMKYFHGQVPK